MTDLEKAVKDLQDNLVVISEIERRQSALLKEHSERIVTTERNFVRIQEAHREILEIQKRTDLRMSEITEKLDGLIHVVDGIKRGRKD